MSDKQLREELKAQPEPLPPIEKTPIGWSLGRGVFLPFVLAIVNRLLPAP